jgi:hypothetical protein
MEHHQGSMKWFFHLPSPLEFVEDICKYT